MKLRTEQLENLLKNIKVNLHTKALGHYREMAWLPFQKHGHLASYDLKSNKSMLNKTNLDVVFYALHLAEEKSGGC